MHSWSLARILLLAIVANGAPVIAKRAFGARFAMPLDSNAAFIDGRPLFGRSKTIRGIAASLAATAVAAPLIGLDVATGLVVALAAMSGDLASSFIKRRLGMAPSSQAIGLDQIPESLLPLLACRAAFGLDAADIAAGVGIFFIGELALSRLLYRFHVRERPY
jgi:CDP-diglyceride synthetase